MHGAADGDAHLSRLGRARARARARVRVRVRGRGRVRVHEVAMRKRSC